MHVHIKLICVYIFTHVLMYIYNKLELTEKPLRDEIHSVL